MPYSECQIGPNVSYWCLWKAERLVAPRCAGAASAAGAARELQRQPDGRGVWELDDVDVPLESAVNMYDCLREEADAAPTTTEDFLSQKPARHAHALVAPHIGNADRNDRKRGHHIFPTQATCWKPPWTCCAAHAGTG
jgi:hypothetical protein